MNRSVILGKSVFRVSRIVKRSGSTWPGHVALKTDPHFIRKILQKNPNLKIILVAGTNGKTTTTKLIQEVFLSSDLKVFRNEAGANLMNGVASALLKHSDSQGKINYFGAIFEIDENTLPQIIKELSNLNSQISVVLLNLFRDQLDRYGEVNTIAKHWLESLKTLSKTSTLITNGDDPMLTFIGKESGLKSYYFGLNTKFMEKKEISSDVDFLYCPNCNTKLYYSKRSYSHLGIYSCSKCSFTHPNTTTFENLPNPMLGLYNIYNINAVALLFEKAFQLKADSLKEALKKFEPAFGRQERVLFKGKNIFLQLSKNPTGFNQSIQAILASSPNPNVLLLLNDRVPDGRDVSWIWDVDFEELSKKAKSITVSGDRTHDMALRIKYCEAQNSQISNLNSDTNLQSAIESSLGKIQGNETLFILATYSAMLDTRKILKGRSIL